MAEVIVMKRSKLPNSAEAPLHCYPLRPKGCAGRPTLDMACMYLRVRSVPNEERGGRKATVSFCGLLGGRARDAVPYCQEKGFYAPSGRIKPPNQFKLHKFLKSRLSQPDGGDK